MRIVRSITAAAAIGFGLLPLCAAADEFDISDTAAQKYVPAPRNEVSVGAGWQSNTSAYFGRYNGHPDKGFSALGDFSLRGGDAWDSNGTFYYRAEGHDLGYDTRSIDLRLGQQGTWGVRLYYDGVPYIASTNFHSIWDGSGALVPGVAPGSVKNATTLGPLLTVSGIGTKRDIFGISGKYQLGDWTISSAVRRDHKEGFKENSLFFGSAPVSPTTANISTGAFAYFGEPVDYDTDRYDIAAEYAGERMQLLVGFTQSNFTDNTASRRMVSPFLFTSGYGGAAGNVGGIYGLPPSNSEHQVKAQFGYDISPTTRLNANFQYGLAMQNAAFPAGRENTNLAVIQQPRNSLDGAIRSIFANVALTARPLPKMDVRLAYTMDDRANITSRNSYTDYYGSTASSEATLNLPLSYRFQQLKAEAGYRVAPETKVTLNYAYEATHRSYADTADVSENKVQAKIRTSLFEGLFGSMSYLHADRQAHNYNGANVWLALGSTQSNDFSGLVKFYEASRLRDEVKGSVDYSPLPNLSGMLSATFRNDSYPKSILGLRSNYNFSIGPDINWEVNKSLNVHAYYFYERYFFNQNDIYWTTSTCNSNGVTQNGFCNGLWNGKTTDDSQTVGVNLEWQAIPDLFKVDVDYTFNYGNAAYSIANGGLLALGGVANASNLTAPGPNVRTTLNTITLRGRYQLTPNVALVGGYTFANFTTNDYAFNQTAAQYTNALFSGDSKPSYNIHMVFAMVRVHW